MIQIQRPEQFQRAAERLLHEPQSVRRQEPGLFSVRNKRKGTEYPVRIERVGGKPFATCYCEAGSPTKGDRLPLPCKHVAAVLIFLRAVRAMRQRAVS